MTDDSKSWKKFNEEIYIEDRVPVQFGVDETKGTRQPPLSRLRSFFLLCNAHTQHPRRYILRGRGVRCLTGLSFVGREHVQHNTTAASSAQAWAPIDLRQQSRPQMLLSSSLEPNGPKSTHHYIILHYGNKRELIKLPETFSDLKTEVESAYHIDRDRFHVETKELNICAGDRIRVPEEAWSDLAKLLGNVYVVPCSKEPSVAEVSCQSEKMSNKEHGLMSEKPLRSKEHPESEVPSRGEEALERVGALKRGETLEREENNEELNREEVLYPHPESFPGPEAPSLPRPDVIKIDKNALYQQILDCDPRVSGVLAAIREEIKLYNHSSSHIKWQCWQISPSVWSDFRWLGLPYSMLVLRYSLSEATSDELQVWFGTEEHAQFQFHINVSGVTYSEVKNDRIDEHQIFKRSHSMHAAGDHSIALVCHRSEINVFFDFKEYTILPGLTMVYQLPGRIWVSGFPSGIEVDVYKFRDFFTSISRRECL